MTGLKRVNKSNTLSRIFMFAPCINIIKTLIIPTDAHNYKNHKILKQYKNYNTCSDMFRFTQEPSSGKQSCA